MTGGERLFIIFHIRACSQGWIKSMRIDTSVASLVARSGRYAVFGYGRSQDLQAIHRGTA